MKKRKFFTKRLKNNSSLSQIIELEEAYYEDLKPEINISLKNTLSNLEDKNFFKRSIIIKKLGNRYYCKKLLTILNGVLLLLFICELFFTIFRLMFSNYFLDNRSTELRICASS